MAGCRPSPTHKMVDALIEETLFNFNVSKRNNFSELDKRMSLFNASKDVSLSGIKGDDLSEIFDEAAADAARQVSSTCLYFLLSYITSLLLE